MADESSLPNARRSDPSAGGRPDPDDLPLLRLPVPVPSDPVSFSFSSSFTSPSLLTAPPCPSSSSGPRMFSNAPAARACVAESPPRPNNRASDSTAPPLRNKTRLARSRDTFCVAPAALHATQSSSEFNARISAGTPSPTRISRMASSSPLTLCTAPTTLALALARSSVVSVESFELPRPSPRSSSFNSTSSAATPSQSRTTHRPAAWKHTDCTAPAAADRHRIEHPVSLTTRTSGSTPPHWSTYSTFSFS